MRKLSAQEVRKTWLNFFKERGHVIEPGANLIPENDPTLLWINSGVAALKKYFDGSQVPPARRITNVQKSIRTNDIENVGKTARHHTFFEMLGNFSIGDYFRKEVIPWAFDILTNDKYFGMDKNKLYITYNPMDKESHDLWMKVGISEDHLIPLEENFWEIGEGPCGPNTEVFFDRGEIYDPKHLGVELLKQDIENDRYIEIWGIVFSQYNAEKGLKRSEYKELPSKNIDTGAGLERICCILQGTDSNFETDLFWPIIEKTQELSGKKYEDDKMAFRVIADHIRTCVFALADGAYFSNSLRGYVLRRLLRRAMRYGQKLGIDGVFLYKLVDTVVDIMKDFYPYLIDKKEFIKKLIIEEENKFLKTLKSGENLLTSIINKNHTLTGKDAFLLYDTYGFPYELTKEIALENNIKLNDDEFNKLMEEQKNRARSSRKEIDSMNVQSKDLLDFKTPSEFLYDTNKCESKVIGLFVDGKKVEEIVDKGYVVFEKTPFYSEMGGQVSDTGTIYNNDTKAVVSDVRTAPNKQNMHFVEIEYGSIKVGDIFTLEIDKLKRYKIECNHSATHLLHRALKEILGKEIEQKGSFVCDKYLRFDFNYLNKLTDSQLISIEKLVNKYIQEELEERTLILSYDKAIKTGAEHEFEQKYGDEIRVVCFGDVSKEFCGGTHVKNSKEIGTFIINSEQSIAAGIRRIEATTSFENYEIIKDLQGNLKNIENILGCKSINESITKIENMLLLNKELNQKIQNMNNKILEDKANNLVREKTLIKDNVNFVFLNDKLTRENLILLKDILDKKIENTIGVLVGKDDTTRLPILCFSNLKDSNINAKKVFQFIVSKVGGNGGGKDNLCNGAISKFDIGKEEIIKFLDENL